MYCPACDGESSRAGGGGVIPLEGEEALVFFTRRGYCSRAHHVFKDVQRSVKLTILAIGRDERGVGGGRGVGARPQHALVHLESLLGLATHVASNDDCVVGSNLRLYALSWQPYPNHISVMLMTVRMTTTVVIIALLTMMMILTMETKSNP